MSEEVGKRVEAAAAIRGMAEDLEITEKQAYLQVQAFGRLQDAMEMLDAEKIDETVDIVMKWQDIMGYDDIDDALTRESIRENLKLAAEMQDEFNIPGEMEHMIRIRQPRGDHTTLQEDLLELKHREDRDDEASRCRIGVNTDVDVVDIGAEGFKELEWLEAWVEKAAAYYRESHSDATQVEDAARQISREIAEYLEEQGWR